MSTSQGGFARPAGQTGKNLRLFSEYATFPGRATTGHPYDIPVMLLHRAAKFLRFLEDVCKMGLDFYHFPHFRGEFTGNW